MQFSYYFPLYGVFIGVYTPMKRYSIGCTWVGAVVGAMPPLMGYVGATGSIQPASLVLAALLYCWQFPHFNALSWNLRADYTRAGYRVMCAVNQRLCRFTSLRYSLSSLIISYHFIITFLLPYVIIATTKILVRTLSPVLGIQW